MIFGLQDSAVDKLREVFRRYPDVVAVKVFGSRALRCEKLNSDIDIVLWGKIDDQLLGRIYGELEELSLPFLFDVIVYAQIRHHSLRRHIDEHAVVLYETDQVVTHTNVSDGPADTVKRVQPKMPAPKKP